MIRFRGRGINTMQMTGTCVDGGGGTIQIAVKHNIAPRGRLHPGANHPLWSTLRLELQIA